jgi:hypothetical protein
MKHVDQSSNMHKDIVHTETLKVILETYKWPWLNGSPILLLSIDVYDGLLKGA